VVTGVVAAGAAVVAGAVGNLPVVVLATVVAVPEFIAPSPSLVPSLEYGGLPSFGDLRRTAAEAQARRAGYPNTRSARSLKNSVANVRSRVSIRSSAA
jgi:hypothetical protein